LKTKIIIGILAALALFVIAFGLLWSKDLSKRNEISAYFSQDKPVYIFNRPDECRPSDLDWTINNRRLVDWFDELIASPYWKSVIVQQIDEKHYVLAFEQSREFRDVQLDSLCYDLGINVERKFLSVNDRDGVWTIRTAGNFHILSNGDESMLRTDLNSQFDERFNQRDKNASFIYLLGEEIQEFYCFGSGYRAYFNVPKPEIQVQSMGSSDLTFYNLLPKSISYFEFLDKNLLQSLYPSWTSSPLMEYCESGVIFSAYNNIPLFVVPVSDLFSANELLESISGNSQFENILIKELRNVIPEHDKILGIALENSIVLSISQSVLEDVALSYQMQSGFNTTTKFEEISNNSANNVHYRWFNQQRLLSQNQVARLPIAASHGFSYFRNRDGLLRSVVFAGESNQANSPDVKSKTAQVVWNFSLKNINSSFHLNVNPYVGIFNPADRAFSIVDANKAILTSITLSEGVKTIHALDKGFLIETFEKLYWIPDQSGVAQKEYAFKGKIQSTIATYVWNGDKFITFISEQKLHKLSLKTGEVERLNIPIGLSESLPQLHAFNYKGALHIGYFGTNEFHAVDIAKNKWFKEPLSGEIKFSHKIDGKIHVVETINGKGVHRIMFGAEQQIFNNIRPQVIGIFAQNQEYIWLLKYDNDVYVYWPRLIKGNLLTLPVAEVSAVEPVTEGSNLVGLLVLNDVQNEITFFEASDNGRDLEPKLSFRGSKFVRYVGNRNCLTFVEGQLVMYSF